MNPELISTLGLLICLAPALVHPPEVLSPLLARWPVNWILPFFGPGFPKRRIGLTRDEMLDAARGAGPKGKEDTSSNYIFLMLFEGRQISLASWAVAAAILYGLSLGLDARATTLDVQCTFGSVRSGQFQPRWRPRAGRTPSGITPWPSCGYRLRSSLDGFSCTQHLGVRRSVMQSGGRVPPD